MKIILAIDFCQSLISSEIPVNNCAQPPPAPNEVVGEIALALGD
ncbi:MULTISPECIES: hypothetical protein [unclassified Glutamicibacter]